MSITERSKMHIGRICALGEAIDTPCEWCVCDIAIGLKRRTSSIATSARPGGTGFTIGDFVLTGDPEPYRRCGKHRRRYRG
jgi:hypothetical protein